MNDIIIPLGYGSKHGNIELRYALRGIERHLSNYRDIYIIGVKPDFINWDKVKHLPYPDKWPTPDHNIAAKIHLAFQQPFISDDVLFFNDDHYLLTDFDARAFPYFYQGTLEDYIQHYGDNGYGRRVKNTLKILKEGQLQTKYFDIHTPIVYNKTLFIKTVLPHVDYNSMKGFVIKSLYGNGCNIEGIETTDAKTQNTPGPDVKILSSHAFISQDILRFLAKTFPTKSQYEL